MAEGMTYSSDVALSWYNEQLFGGGGGGLKLKKYKKNSMSCEPIIR